jgi:hypothetical protein
MKEGGREERSTGEKSGLYSPFRRQRRHAQSGHAKPFRVIDRSPVYLVNLSTCELAAEKRGSLCFF